MNVYRVVIEQYTAKGLNCGSDSFDVRARSGSEALRRALALARSNGFQQSRPLEVVKMERLTADLR